MYHTLLPSSRMNPIWWWLYTWEFSMFCGPSGALFWYIWHSEYIYSITVNKKNTQPIQEYQTLLKNWDIKSISTYRQWHWWSIIKVASTIRFFIIGYKEDVRLCRYVVLILWNHHTNYCISSGSVKPNLFTNYKYESQRTRFAME